MNAQGLRKHILWSFLALSLSGPSHAQKFYPDDPLEIDPPPMPTTGPEVRALSEILEWAGNQFGNPGERHPEIGVIPALGVNTLGEVPDGPWYVNRHGKKRMTEEELVRGPGDQRPPTKDAKWQVLTVKPYGVRPGILIADSEYELYLLRFDPVDRLEMATGAELVSSKIFHALGYHVPENYLVYFDRDQLVASEAGKEVTSYGERRHLFEEDIDRFLRGVARDPKKGFRAVATRVPGSWQGLLGPYQVFGTRSDDPNDIVPHGHRRDLRGLYVFCAWVNHSFMSALNTLDALVEDEGVPYVRHHIVDFSATLGSAGDRPKQAHEGNDPLFEARSALKNVLGMGLHTARWMRAYYPDYPSVGRFEYTAFDPDQWSNAYEIAPFANRLSDDEFWAAQQVMAFTDEDIRALVHAGEFSDPKAEEWIAECLMARRDRIGSTFFAKVLPLDHFRVENKTIEFDNLAVNYGFVAEPTYTVQWSRFDNETEEHTPIGGIARSLATPPIVDSAEQDTYLAAKIRAEGDQKSVTVYFRKKRDGLKVVGIERDWPGKVIADPAKDIDTGRSRYVDLEQQQKDLFQLYAQEYNERTGRSLTAQENFDSMTISERTTFDAVTHALLRSELTDAEGKSLGRSIDLVKRVERIAGQYYGRSGDEQFRLYVDLLPNAIEILDKSQEFHRTHENTVYHVGYPFSYRQTGKEPTIQVSVSEDGSKADIDVDYRSSKMPRAMFNGHLTSANSDVRAGDNSDRHNNRWGGLIAWWRGVFGNLGGKQEREAMDLVYAEPPEPATPLPSDRPRATRIEEIHEAAEEFLADWLVRGKVDEALEFVSPRSYACLNLDDDSEEEAVGAREAREKLKELMEISRDELGHRDNLTEAIDEVIPWNKTARILDHPYARDFTLVEMTNQNAEQYVCGQVPDRPAGAGDDYGNYWGVVFRFKRERAGILGLLWMREQGNWRIVSYRAFQH